MATNIGPKIGIDGEKKYRDQINNIIQQAKTLDSEMKAVTASFDESTTAQEKAARTGEVLAKQIKVQESRVAELSKMLDKATAKFGEADTRTLKWQQAVNEATADLKRLERQAAEAADTVEDLGDEMDDAASPAGKLMDFMSGDFNLDLSSVVDGVKDLAESMFELVDSTQEYRTIMASLEVSSANAGYTAAETTEIYRTLQGVLGDQQTAATATANLQAVGLSQEQLTELTYAAIGAWATYGDSIPIDGLAEAINETIQAGEVTGSFADVLNWAGESEDEFNVALSECQTEAEKANLVMQALAEQGLAKTGEAWIQNNADIVATNQSTDALDQAWARLGGKVAPLVAGLRQIGADGLNGIINAGEQVVAFFSELPGKMWQWGVDMVQGLIDGINSMVDKVRAGAENIANQIKSFLHFSRPDEGPLRDYEQWMPDFVRGMAAGIDRNSYLMSDAIHRMASDMALGMDVAVSTGHGASVTIGQVVFNGYTSAQGRELVRDLNRQLGRLYT